MERSQHKKAVEKWLAQFKDPAVKQFNANTRFEISRRPDMRHVVYAMNEMHMWPDCDGMGPEAVLKAWLLVERLLEEKFPDTLKM